MAVEIVVVYYKMRMAVLLRMSAWVGYCLISVFHVQLHTFFPLLYTMWAFTHGALSDRKLTTVIHFWKRIGVGRSHPDPLLGGIN